MADMSQLSLSLSLCWKETDAVYPADEILSLKAGDTGGDPD